MNVIMNVFAWVVMFIFLFFVLVLVRAGCTSVWDKVSNIPVPIIIAPDGDGEDELAAFEQGRKAGQKFIDDLKN